MGTESENNGVLKEGFLVKRVSETLLNILYIHIWPIISSFIGLLTNDVRFIGPRGSELESSLVCS